MALAMPFSIPSWRICRVGAEDVVAHQFDPRSESRGEIFPSLPIVLTHAVFQQHDRILIHPGLPDLDQFLEVMAFLVDLKRMYLPSSHISLAAGSRQMEISSPGL